MQKQPMLFIGPSSISIQNMPDKYVPKKVQEIFALKNSMEDIGTLNVIVQNIKNVIYFNIDPKASDTITCTSYIICIFITYSLFLIQKSVNP